MSVRPSSTLVTISRQHAETRPDQLAYTFLVDGESEEKNLTFADIDAQARAIAAHLQQHRLQGQRILLLYPHGLEFVAGLLGCFYGGAVAVPTYSSNPARFARDLPRLQPIITDARPTQVFTTTAIHNMARTLFQDFPVLAQLQWVATDALNPSLAALWREPELGGDALALLQYTSGSSGSPRGVMVTHRNLIHNEGQIYRAFGHDEGANVVGWLPVFHDMGLIGNVLQPLFCGSRCVLMSPLHFLQSPLRWLRAIHRYRPHTSGGPNFGYDLCVSKITPEQASDLDLSSWKLAYVGAEPVRAATLRRFYERFAPSGFRLDAFYPCYGLAEATLFVTGGCRTSEPRMCAFDARALEQGRLEPSAGDAPARALVSCGYGWGDQQVLIVDPDSSQECEAGRVGEIWVHGDSVALGYWNRPEETQATFRARLADGPQASFLRTGDLGAVFAGEIYVVGRSKDLIILRGRNYYPHDIEETVEQCHPAVRRGCSAAFSVETGDAERLVVMAEIDTRRAAPSNHQEVIARIRGAVSVEHEIQAHVIILLEMGAIPKTTSGKIRRAICRQAFQSEVPGELTRAEFTDADADEPAAPTPEPVSALDLAALTDWLSAQVAQVAGLSPDEIDPDRPLSEYGFDSAMLVEWSAKLSAALNTPISPTLFFEHPTIASLLRHLSNGGSTCCAPAVPAAPDTRRGDAR